MERSDGPFRKDHPSDVQKIKRDNVPEKIWVVCKKYVVAFPKDLPKGVPPKQMGHEFKIELEGGTTPIYKLIYKLSSIELQDPKTQIDSTLEHGLARPSQSP